MISRSRSSGYKPIILAVVVALLLLARLVAEPVALADAPGARAPDACFPTCRSGFVCSPSLQCVSACNPACAADQECTADGQCVASTQSQTQSQSQSQSQSQTQTVAPNPGEVPPDTNDPKQRRLHAPISWSLYAGAGYGQAEDGYITIDDPDFGGSLTEHLKHEGPVATVGFGFRKYFTQVLGLQARGSLLVGTGNGFLTGAVADGTLRIGPFGTGFPIFFGGGLFLGPAVMSRDGVTGEKLLGGAVIEVGFLFGDADRFELVLRAYGGAASLLESSVGDLIYPVLVMGYRL
jgi:hypothetical protein